MVGGSGFRNGLANLAVQYNYTSIAVAVLLWDKIYSSVPSWSSSVLSSFVFLGSIVGMLTFGYLGDVLGRPTAMKLTLALMILGALGSAVLSWGGVYTCTLLVAIWRFLLGIGTGGVYPLSAAGAYEDDSIGDSRSDDTAPALKTTDLPSAGEQAEGGGRRARAAWALFWQQPGQMLPYMLALVLLASMKQADEAVQYRIILGAGAVPPIVLLLRTSRRHWMTKDAVSLDMKMSSFWPFQATDKSFTPDGNGILALPKAYWALACDSSINKQLAGTALCWFFFDVYVYGISLYTPEILEDIFGNSETLAEDYWENVLSVVATLPASLLSIWVLGKVSSRNLQAFGFGLASGAFLLVAIFWSYLEKHSKTSLFLLFLLQKNVSLFGVATTTFVLPNELFPQRIRSSCNGLSAAAGKLGAFLGSFLFPYIYDNSSMAAVFYTCAAVALAGLATTLLLLPPTAVDDNDKAGTSVESGTGQFRRGGANDEPSETSSLLAA